MNLHYSCPDSFIMSGIGSRSTQGILGFIELSKRYCPYGSHFTIVSRQGHISRSTAPKFEHNSLMHRGLQLVNVNNGTSATFRQNVVANVSEYNKIRPPAGPPSPRFNISTWTRWLLASIVSLFGPFLKEKWDNLRKIEGEVEFVVGEVETAAEVVEKVATVTEKVSSGIAEKLPNNGKLKEAALYVEHISETIAHDAESIEDLLEKVEALKNDFHNIETLIELDMEKIIKQKMD